MRPAAVVEGGEAIAVGEPVELRLPGLDGVAEAADQEHVRALAHLVDVDLQIAALIDVWLLVTTKESNGERNRSLSVLKARGMAHSNQIREFLLTERGIEVADVHGLGEVLTGSARVEQEARRRSKADEPDDFELEAGNGAAVAGTR